MYKVYKLCTYIDTIIILNITFAGIFTLRDSRLLNSKILRIRSLRIGHVVVQVVNNDK